MGVSVGWGWVCRLRFLFISSFVRCVFMPGSGAFFVNLIVTAALMGQGLTLLRIGALAVYVFKRCWARSEAERFALASERPSFSYSVEYATMLNWFTITLVFSFICPIITVFSLLFFAVRHFVDRYVIYFMSDNELGYVGADGRREKVQSLAMHTYAIKYVPVALFIQQFVMLMFFTVRLGAKSGLTLTMLAAVFLLVLFLIWQFYMSGYMETPEARDEAEVEDEVEGGSGGAAGNYTALVIRQARSAVAAVDVHDFGKQSPVVERANEGRGDGNVAAENVELEVQDTAPEAVEEN